MAAIEQSNHNGMFKRVYDPDGVQRPIPATRQFTVDIPFKEKDGLGESFVSAVRVTRNFGATIGTGGTMYALNTPTPGATKQATVAATSFTGRAQFARDIVTRSSTSERAFENMFNDVVMDMEEMTGLYAEMLMAFGGYHVGAIETGATASANSGTIVISKATWSPGVWVEAEGTQWDVYESTLTTKQNTNGPITIGAVNVASRSIVITGHDDDINNCDATDVLVPLGANGVWVPGIRKILANTGSLFGIDAATYGLWKATQKTESTMPAVVSTFTNAGAEQLVRTGTMEETTWYVSPYIWTDLNNDSVTIRRAVESQKGGIDYGTTGIKIYGAGGVGVIKTSPMVPCGEAWGLRTNHWCRPGSSDIRWNFDIEGETKRYFHSVQGYAGYEINNGFDFGMFCRKPSAQIIVTGISVNSLA